jgi:ATP-dependent Clp protease ATP-binding subunit ClpA
MMLSRLPLRHAASRLPEARTMAIKTAATRSLSTMWSSSMSVPSLLSTSSSSSTCSSSLSSRTKSYPSWRSFSSHSMGSVFPGQQGEQQPSYLEQFSVDLTKIAREKKPDPIIGRHDEIRRCLQILARRTKNNPVLIGQAGVGKTAIAEGLAQRIVSGQVPESMKDKRVLSLDVAALVSTSYRNKKQETRKMNRICRRDDCGRIRHSWIKCCFFGSIF